MAMDTYVLYAVDVDGTLIDGITNQSVGHGLQMMLNHGDGSPHVRFAGVMSSKPTVQFTTTALAKALGKVGATGAAIASAVTLFFQKTAESGLRAGASSHLKVVIGAGLIVPRTVRANQDGEAEISYEIFPISSDGSTSPISYTASQSLAGTPDSDEKFTVGPAKINGTDHQAQSIEIDFGIEVQTHSHSGFVYPVRAHVVSTEPRITVGILDAGKLATHNVTGTAQGATDSVFYFRKLDENGTRVADVTAEHVSFTVDDGHIRIENVEGSDNADVTATIIVEATYDGTNEPLVVDATAAIT